MDPEFLFPSEEDPTLEFLDELYEDERDSCDGQCEPMCEWCSSRPYD